MKKSLVLFLWLALAPGLLAQYNLSTPEFLAGLAPSAAGGTAPFDPTTVGPIAGWWKGPDAVSTNSSNVVFYWPDMSGRHKNLTNNIGLYRAPFKTNTLNGLSIVSFELTNYLVARGYTNDGNAEWYCAMKFKSFPAVNSMPMTGGDAAGVSFQRWLQTGGNIWISQGSSLFPGKPWSSFANLWRVFTFRWSTNQFVLLTNNVIMFSGNAGASGIPVGGLVVNSDRTELTSGWSIEYAELLFYAQTNKGTDATAVYGYLTNKWGAANFRP
jgi:hypothetical protein